MADLPIEAAFKHQSRLPSRLMGDAVTEVLQ